MKYNYHNHTKRCMHAKGKDEAYVKAAIKMGYDIIGFSDHCAWRFEDPTFRSGMRMPESEIEDYVNSVRSLQKKYKGKIEIRLGWEVEYLPKYWDWMKETLEKYQFDYIILGHHYGDDEIGGHYNGSIETRELVQKYCDDVCEAMDTGILSYVAHPDLFMQGYKVFDDFAEEISRKIIQKSLDTNMPIEYNLLGISHSVHNGWTGYPYPKFWEMAGKMGATAIIGVDAHDPKAYAENDKIRENAISMLKSYGLKMIEEINYLR